MDVIWRVLSVEIFISNLWLVVNYADLYNWHSLGVEEGQEYTATSK
jgi:hypothetical protein